MERLQAIGYAFVSAFLCSLEWSRLVEVFTEVKRPEHALKIFIRFAIAKGVVTYGLELMMALFNIIQGVTSTIMQTAGFGSTEDTVFTGRNHRSGRRLWIFLKVFLYGR